MNMKKRGLGRSLGDLGLNELLGGASVSTAPEAPSGKKSELKKLPVEVLQPGRYQPRRQMAPDALQELSDSIRAQGIIQPIVVRPVSSDCYEIIAGERRWRAAQLAELTEVPTIVRDISDEAAMAMSLIENIQRQDLNVIEEAVALQRLIEEFEMTHQAVADAVGKSRASVTNILRLLKLNSDVRELLEQGKLDMGHARALLALDDVHQSQTAETVVQQGLSVRETEALIQRLQAGESVKPQEVVVDPNIAALQRNLSDRLGASVNIRHTDKGKGKLVIAYNNLDELDGILERIR